ncbi:glycoside hydrolase family 16 protein [Salipiger pacificus]|uniref:Glycoside hydrolase family 16 protein n=2 Tax=Salipiger mangrovisoli TaxID=2865933 RepID=A0ABR9X0Q8_9RHOB|nr:glycoside hydrolase family 16 protein [Salipiger mangrovisoli]
MTNAAEAVFLDTGILAPEADALLPPLRVLTDDGLSLRSARLPDALLPMVREYMQANGQGNRADKVKYGTARITTAQTWSQTYGYFEIEARMPRGKGRWPAFWMTFAGNGWPPEIDVFEAYGAGLDSPTPKDGTFNTAVFFDALDADGNPTQSVDVENPFAADPAPRLKKQGKRDIFKFTQLNNQTDLDANIYDEFNVYAALWTPEEITFYFGKTRETLKEIFKTPTPDDLKLPMVIIANDQFTARGGFWSPRPEAIDRVLDPENDFRIRRITVRALEPETILSMADGDSPYSDADSVILDTPGDDVIAPGGGFDIIRLSGGSNEIRLSRGRAQKIIEGFDADDVIELEGYPFTDSEDALTRLTQVGPDVWLPSGSDPSWPHTVILRDLQVEDVRPEQLRVRWSEALHSWHGEAGDSKRPQIDADGDGLLESPFQGAWFNDKGKPVRMIGTEAPDRFMIGNPGSTIEVAAGRGLDQVETWIPYSLPRDITYAIARRPGLELRASASDTRLETRADRVTLSGGTGDDLYVIAPEAARTRLRLGGGNDRIRGLKSGDVIEVLPADLAWRSKWQLTTLPHGLEVRFAEGRSLLIEGGTEAAFLDALEAGN